MVILRKPAWVIKEMSEGFGLVVNCVSIRPLPPYSGFTQMQTSLILFCLEMVVLHIVFKGFFIFSEFIEFLHGLVDLFRCGIPFIFETFLSFLGLFDSESYLVVVGAIGNVFA